MVCQDDKVSYSASSLFFFLLTITWPGLLTGIHLYVKIAENFVCLILQDRFWFVYLPIGSTIRFEFLAQFAVDHLIFIINISFLINLPIYSFIPLEFSTLLLTVGISLESK